LRPVSLALLFAGALRRFAACVARAQTGLVAGAAALLAGADHPAVPRFVPGDVLLLSGRVLQGVLGRSTELRRRRDEKELSGRANLSAHHPEHPPLLPIYRGVVPVHPGLRRLEGALVRRRCRAALRHWRRNAGARPERHAPVVLYARLSLDASH